LEPHAIDDPLEVLELVVSPALEKRNAPETTVGVACMKRQSDSPSLPNFVTTVPGGRRRLQPDELEDARGDRQKVECG
jgi:hypothetical protein